MFIVCIILISFVQYGEELLPDYWTKTSHETLEDIVLSLVPEGSEYLDWRHFLVLVALPWPPATQQSLLETLERFRAKDTAGTGHVTWDQYRDVQLWYQSEPPNPDPSELVKYDRDNKLRLVRAGEKHEH